MELVLTWFNIAFNLIALGLGVRIMFCLETVRETLNEMQQLLAELRDEKAERLKAAEWVRERGDAAE